MNNEHNVSNIAYNIDELIFALDIGTRSIIGIVAIYLDDVLKVIDIESMEHSKRAMIDGQIEDIFQVAKVAEIVKNNLEKRLNVTFRKVSIAAAGRSLKTQRAINEITLNPDIAITKAMIEDLEETAVKQTQNVISTSKKGDDLPVNLYCVGYSVVRYYLDDYPLQTLLDHKGMNAKVELIATFLPSEVVESLYTVMNKIGLEVESLTLEPIAAINAIIPQELRILNLALVDIGAGTSDIVVCDNGTVVAYTMATQAGDEITEAIIKELLVSFDVAEQIKAKIDENDENITYKNILGYTCDITTKELTTKIKPYIYELCEIICTKVLEINGKSPTAVFLVGGGSKTPFICEIISDILDIEIQKVAIGGNSYMKKYIISDIDICQPQYVTPIGIAVNCMANRQSIFSVFVNNEPIHLNKSENATLMDVLLACGYKQNTIIARNGKNITYELNGMKKVVRGGFPKPIELIVNGVAAGITTKINSDDQIIVNPAVSGNDAIVNSDDIKAQFRTLQIVANGESITIPPTMFINGVQITHNVKLNDLDTVQVIENSTVRDVVNFLKLDISNMQFKIDGKTATLVDHLYNGNIMEYGDFTKPANIIKNIPAPKIEVNPFNKNDNTKTIVATSSNVGTSKMPNDAVNNPTINTTDKPSTVIDEKAVNNTADKPSTVIDEKAVNTADKPSTVIDEKPTKTRIDPLDAARARLESTIENTICDKPITVILNREKMVFDPKPDSTPHLFLDMLNYVEIDPTQPQGDIVLTINGKPASYLDPISDNDVVNIGWRRRS